MDSVRLMLWCPTCMIGLQLPVFAARSLDLFAEHDLQVEFVDMVPARDTSLAALSVRVDAVADGAADFAVTAIPYLLAANARRSVSARFVMSFHQRSPIAAVVREDAPVVELDDLAGAKTAHHGLDWFVKDYEAALREVGLDEPKMVDTPYGGAYGAHALARRQIDVVPTWVDTLPILQATALCEVRAIPLDIDVLTTGLLAADRIPADIVARMCAALRAGLNAQRTTPDTGIAEYVRQFPDIPVAQAQLGWTTHAEYAADRFRADISNEALWERTINYTAATHGIRPPALEDVYRVIP